MFVPPFREVSACGTLASPLRCFLVTVAAATVLLACAGLALGQAPVFNAPGDVSLWGPAGNPPPQIVAKANRLVSEIVEPEITLDIDPRKSKILRTSKPVSRISITNPAVVEVVQFSPTEFELIGGTTGQTAVTFWFGEEYENREILRYLVRVEPNKTEEDRRHVEVKEFERMINEFVPGSMIQLIPVADKIIVKGQARSAEEAQEIMAILQEGSGGAGQAGGQSGLYAGPAASPFPGGVGLPGNKLINLLHVPGEMQVMLKVRVAELTRSALRRMGAELEMSWGEFSFNSLLGAAGGVSAILDTTDVDLTMSFISSNSYSKILAEPNLVTLSGHPASFISGGEFAVPVVVGVEGAAAATTNFRGFGTQIQFTPTVIDKDRIRLNVVPTVSSLNKQNSVDGIPGVDTSSVETTVDLREGQWLAIAGLIQDQQSGSKVRVPFVGDVPYLDMLFSRKRVSREETELIILVSPELVHPLEAEQAPLILPGMEVTEPSDWGFFFAGRYEGRDDCHHRSTVWPVLQRKILDARKEAKRTSHFQQSEAYYIQGDYGFSE